jgi:hypothetical protein
MRSHQQRLFPRNLKYFTFPNIRLSLALELALSLHISLPRLGKKEHIGDVMVSVFASSAVDCGFEPQSDQAKDYAIGISCLWDDDEVHLILDQHA